MVDSDNDFDLDNVNAGDGKDKIDLGDVCSGGVDSNDDGAVDDVGGFGANGGEDADYGNGARKFDCSDDIEGGDGDDNDDVDVDDDGYVDSNIDNDTNCGDDKSKYDSSEDAADDDSNSNPDGGLDDDSLDDTNDDGRDGNDSDGKSNDDVMDIKMMTMMIIDVSEFCKILL